MTSFLSTLYSSANPDDSVLDKYLYLHENVLHNELEWCIPDSDKPFVVALCIYRMNRRACRVSYNEERVVFDPTPFLQFVVEYHSLAEKSPETPAMYMFPVINYECIDRDNQTHFEETCISNAIEMLKLEQIPNTSAVSAYKGFVMHNTIVYAVIDYDELAKQFRPSAEPPMFAIADELVLQKRILGIPVDPNVTAMFEEHPYMWTIESEGETTPIPLCLYHCYLSDRQSYNESKSQHPLYDNAHNAETKQRTDHPLYHEVYVFSKQPLVGVDPVGATPAPYQRYAVFVSTPVLFADHVDETRDVAIMEKKRQMLTYLDAQNETANVIVDTATRTSETVQAATSADLTQPTVVASSSTGGAIDVDDTSDAEEDTDQPIEEEEDAEEEDTEELANAEEDAEEEDTEELANAEEDAEELPNAEIPDEDSTENTATDLPKEVSPNATETPPTYTINPRVASMSDQDVENELDEQLLMVPSMFFKLSSADMDGTWGVKYAAQFVAY